MVIKFKDFKINEETAVATAGNTNGMGAITAPTMSAIPGDVAGSTPGSGDLATGLGTHMVPSLKQFKAYKHIDLLKDMKKKKKKKKKVKKYSDFIKESITIEEFINNNRDLIYDTIKKRPGMKNVPVDDVDFKEWIFEDEYLYNLAIEKDVDLFLDDVPMSFTGNKWRYDSDKPKPPISDEEYNKFQEEWEKSKKTELEFFKKFDEK